MDPNKRCTYTCHIEELDQREERTQPPIQHNKLTENHTVTCHENEMDVFNPTGFVDHPSRSKQSDKTVLSPDNGTAQKSTVLKENTSGTSNVESKKQAQRAVILPSHRIPDSLQENLSNSKKPLSVMNLQNPTANTPLITASKNTIFSRTSQNVTNTTASFCTPRHDPSTPPVSISSNIHPQAGLRAMTPNLSKTSLPRTPITAKCNVTNSALARNLSTLHATLPTSGTLPRTSNVRNISPMDLLIDLTKPKSNSVKKTLGSNIQSLKFVMTSKQRIVGPGLSNSGVSMKCPRSSYSSAAMSSRANTARNVRTTPIPLAPKPTPYIPIERNPSANYKRLALKTVTVLDPVTARLPQSIKQPQTTQPPQSTQPPHTTQPPQTSTVKATTTPLIFHSTEFVPQGGNSSSIKVKTRPFPSTLFSGSIQTTNRPTNIAQSGLQGIPQTSSTRPFVPVTTNVVQLSKTTTRPNFNEVPSKIVKLNTSPNLVVSKSNHTTSKIVQLNTDPAQLAANFLRLRAKATQGGSKTKSLLSMQNNPRHNATSSPVLSVSKHLPVSAIPQTSTTTKVPHSSVTSTKPASQSFNSVAAVKACNDSDGMAVVVGSPEQITKLLSENPNMIQLLGSKSTDYLGQLLTSHSKNESCVRQLYQAEQQNKHQIIKEALGRPTPPMIDLTKSPSKHVTDLTKVVNESPITSSATNLQSTPSSFVSTSKSSSVPSTLSRSTLPSTLTQSGQLAPIVPCSLSSSLSSTQSNMVSTPASSIKINKIDLTKGRNAVRKIDRSCLNTTVGPKRPVQDTETISLGKPPQSGIKSPTLIAHTATNAKSNPQYIFHNRRFLHASLDTPNLEKKAKSVSPLSSPTKIMAHIEDQSKNLKPVLSKCQLGVEEYSQKPDATKQSGKEDKTLNDRETASIAKKDIVKSCVKRTYTKRKYTKRKELDKNISCKTKKKDAQASGKRKSDENDLRMVKRTKIHEDDIVLPDFARIKQSDLRSKRLEKINQELNVTFIITSEEGLEVKARTCEGTCM